MDNENGSVPAIWSNTTRTISQAVVSLRDSSLRQFSKLTAVSQHLEGPIEKASDFYQNHKEVILISSAVALTFFLTRHFTKKTSGEKARPKRAAPSLKKNFMSEEEPQEASLFTGQTAESSEKEKIAKRCKLKILEKLSSSEGEDEKIFFQMYKTYQNA